MEIINRAIGIRLDGFREGSLGLLPLVRLLQTQPVLEGFFSLLRIGGRQDAR